MDELEKLLYEAVPKAVSGQQDFPLQGDAFSKTYGRTAVGLVLVFLDGILLVNHLLLHIVLIAGALGILKGTIRYRSAPKMLAVRLAWIGVLCCTVTYDIMYLFNSTYIWKHFLTKTYGYRRWEILVVTMMFQLTMWFFTGIMLKMQKYGIGKIAANPRNAAVVSENIKAARGYFMSDTVLLWLCTVWDMHGILLLMVQLFLLIKGKRSMDKAGKKLLLIDDDELYRTGSRRSEGLLTVAELVTAVGVAVFAAVNMYQTYLVKKSQVHFITDESRFYAAAKDLWEHTGGKRELSYEEAQKRAGQIRQELIGKGVKTEIVNELLSYDLLRLDNSGQVLEAVSYDVLERPDSDDGSFRTTKKEQGIPVTTTMYAFEKNSHHETESGRYEYEILVYVEFSPEIRSEDSLLFSDLFSDGIGGSSPDQETDQHRLEDTWVLMTDMKEQTVYYQGEWVKNRFGSRQCETELMKGSHYRAYCIGTLVLHEKERIEGVPLYRDLGLGITCLKKKDFYNEVTGSRDYEVKDLLYGDVGFQLTEEEPAGGLPWKINASLN